MRKQDLLHHKLRSFILISITVYKFRSDFDLLHYNYVTENSYYYITVLILRLNFANISLNFL